MVTEVIDGLKVVAEGISKRQDDCGGGQERPAISSNRRLLADYGPRFETIEAEASEAVKDIKVLVAL
jgi:hypothetical protein